MNLQTAANLLFAATLLQLSHVSAQALYAYKFNERVYYAGLGRMPGFRTERSLSEAEPWGGVPEDASKEDSIVGKAILLGNWTLPGRSPGNADGFPHRRHRGRNLQGERFSAASSMQQNLAVTRGRLLAGFNGIDAYTMRTAGTGKYSNSQSFFKPPDVGGCVGSGFIVQTTNNAISMYNYRGVRVAGPASTNQFLGLLPAVRFPTYRTVQTIEPLSDASCIYDRSSKRFFLSLIWISSGTASPWYRFGFSRPGAGNPPYQGGAVVLAVSQPGDPRHPWRVFLIPYTNDGFRSHNDAVPPLSYGPGPFLGDYPQLGVDQNGVYITTNQFSAVGFVGANVYAFGKRNLLLAPPSFLGVRFALPSPALSYIGTFFPLQATADPRDPYDARRGGTMWFSFLLPPNGLGVLAIVNTAALNAGSLAVSLAVGAVTTPNYEVSQDPVQQRQGPVPWGRTQGFSIAVPVQANSFVGGEIQSLGGTWVRGGASLWVAWTAGSSSSTTGIAVAELVPQLRGSGATLSLALRLGAYRIISVPGQSLIFPALNVNGQGRGLVAFTLVGRSYFPSAAYAFLNTATKTVGPTVNWAAAGRAPLDDSEGYRDPASGMRFGDFQTVTMDEAGNAWAIVEYVSAAHQYGPALARLTNGISFANWATFIFRVKV